MNGAAGALGRSGLDMLNLGLIIARTVDSTDSVQMLKAVKKSEKRTIGWRSKNKLESLLAHAYVCVKGYSAKYDKTDPAWGLCAFSDPNTR